MILDDGHISMALVFKGDNPKSEKSLEHEKLRTLNNIAKEKDFL